MGGSDDPQAAAAAAAVTPADGDSNSSTGGDTSGGRQQQQLKDRRKLGETADSHEMVTQCGTHDLRTQEGVLVLTIVQAENLPNADAAGGGSDPYVRVGLGGQEYTTKVNR